MYCQQCKDAKYPQSTYSKEIAAKGEHKPGSRNMLYLVVQGGNREGCGDRVPK